MAESLKEQLKLIQVDAQDVLKRRENAIQKLNDFLASDQFKSLRCFPNSPSDYKFLDELEDMLVELAGDLGGRYESGDFWTL